jgi:hypothetical protein
MRWALLVLAMLPMTSCTGFQVIAYGKDGTPRMVANVDATMAEGENSAREIVLADGTVMRSVQQRYDGTRVPIGAIDASVAKLGLREAGKTTRNQDTWDGKAKFKGTKDPNIIPDNPETFPVPAPAPAQ